MSLARPLVRPLARGLASSFAPRRGSAPLALDALSAAVAYSTRRLRSDYTGPCMRVRRSSDNAEADIGFRFYPARAYPWWLDEEALLAHVGAGDGFVVTWYDHSGNARNAAQGTAANQPRIVNAGAVEAAGGRPALLFDGVDDTLLAASWGVVAQPYTRALVVQMPTSIVSLRHIINSAASLPNSAVYASTATALTMFAGSVGASRTVAASERAVLLALFNEGQSLFSKNGTESPETQTGSAGYAGVSLASFNGSQWFGCHMQEVVIVNEALVGAARQTLTRNQGAAFGIAVA